MKAKEVMEKYGITRRTLHNWVKRGVIKTEKTPTGRYIYQEIDKKETLRNEDL
jgi:predicted site-specific integrase-resolvase